MTNEQAREQVFKDAEERYPIRATHCRQERKIIAHLKQRFIEKKLKELEGNANTPRLTLQISNLG